MAQTEAKAKYRSNHSRPESSTAEFEVLRDAVCVMTPEMIEHYTKLQLESERAERWEEANLRNLWLLGAFISVQDYVRGKLPRMRKDFLARAKRSNRARRAA